MYTIRRQYFWKKKPYSDKNETEGKKKEDEKNENIMETRKQIER